MVLCSLFDRTFGHFGGGFPFAPRADGGGDGGGGDGGGDGGSSDGGDGGGDAGGSTGDGSGEGEGNSANSEGPGGDTGADDASAADDAQANSDPSAVTNSTDPSDIADVPTNDPALGLRGPGSPSGGSSENGTAAGLVGLPRAGLRRSATNAVNGARTNVRINAVIVSGAPTPWEGIGKGPGVLNVAVTGALIALGETALPKPPSGVNIGSEDHQPGWLRFEPDLRYLNGSVFPPVVPNMIDIRTISNTEEVIENSFN
jgi:hypothetical protein